LIAITYASCFSYLGTWVIPNHHCHICVNSPIF
jgi:hypothetical protein